MSNPITDKYLKERLNIDHPAVKLLAKTLDGYGEPPEQVRQIYRTLYGYLDNNTLSKLHESGYIQAVFDFLDIHYGQWVNAGDFTKLSYPVFNSKFYSFDDVYDEYFKDVITFKVYCKLLVKDGIRALNNILISKLYLIVPSNDFYLNIDHDVQLKSWLVHLFERFPENIRKAVNKRYNAKRIYRILTNANNYFATKKTFNELTLLTRYCRYPIYYLPSKPRSFDDLLKGIKREFYTFDTDNRRSILELNQHVENLDGEKFEDFTIEVPSTGRILQETSNELHHCVGNYIDDVINGSCQIINLKKGNRRKYTVELKRGQQARSYKVTQIKGKYDDDHLEKDDQFVLDLSNIINRGLDLKKDGKGG
jgi:hypothetical protein